MKFFIISLATAVLLSCGESEKDRQAKIDTETRKLELQALSEDLDKTRDQLKFESEISYLMLKAGVKEKDIGDSLLAIFDRTDRFDILDRDKKWTQEHRKYLVERAYEK